ncbi:right-handed parallel beta-helix repeat-containing protein [Planctomyces sp. SH-PL14]|uniref:right-handed parallel beta-helix repeat-containing protein n=1 Tax=Planctomyces sp. SH-PL14 TaxID=1632864 RepID=UPI00078CE96B|nr:right-handed parallel beta-helix repeat-containing protein [Planctomyces sp. SH-PL14]AMV19872.1 hypothetical protein VT03_18390 [Planctomyces sp. SH-PL14]
MTTLTRIALLLSIAGPWGLSVHGAEPSLQERINHSGKKGEARTVLIPAGRYELTEPLHLGPEASGLTLAAEPGAQVEIVGSSRLTGWKRIDEARNVWECRLPDGFPTAPPRQLFLAGSRLVRARTPNTGWLETKETLATKPPLTLGLPDGMARAEWVRQGVVIRGLQKWAGFQLAVTEVDVAAQRVTLPGAAIAHRQEKTNRFWIENAPEALDQPGEWCCDPSARTIRLIPPAGIDPLTANITVPRLRTLVLIDGAADVRLQRLQFSECDVETPPQGDIDMQAAAPRRGAIVLRSVRNGLVEQCTVRSVAGYAVDIARGSRDCIVRRCELSQLGAGGVRIGETKIEEVPEAQVSGHVVEDCRIHDYGQIDFGACGAIVFQAARNTIRHNEIHHAPYTGVSVGWTWGYRDSPCRENLVEKNHIHDLGGKLLSDLGAVYLLGPQPGTVVRGNLIHDLACFDYGGWGLYTDEGSSGMLLEGNVVYRCQTAGFHQHYGKENTIRGNVFVNCGEGGIRRSRDEDHQSFTLEKNVVVSPSPAFLTGNWKKGTYPCNHNLYFTPAEGPRTWTGKSWEEWQGSGHDQHSAIGDPRWLDPDHPERGVRADSPARMLGIDVPVLEDAGPRAAAPK